MTNKFQYLFVVQGHFGQGWEDLSEYEDRFSARADLKEYRMAHHCAPHRIIQRRELVK